MPRFTTFEQAEEAGYRRVNHGTDTDVSGPGYWGYDYQNEEGEETVTVFLSEEFNKLKKLGCFCPMYPPS